MNSRSSKKPSLVTARACVLIFQAFQLFSFSVQFCGLSRLPCPCRPESHKQNTCEPASVSCSPCRSILPCRQVRRVTNIYVLSFCVSSLSSFCILSNSSISVLLADRTAFLLSCASGSSLHPVQRCGLRPCQRQNANWQKACPIR